MVWALVVFADSDGSCRESRAAPFHGRTPGIADVAIAGTFAIYPYWTVKTDWTRCSWRQAASDKDGTIRTTLMKMVAELKDGHGAWDITGRAD